jgi:hypothetical protein
MKDFRRAIPFAECRSARIAELEPRGAAARSRQALWVFDSLSGETR